MKRLSLGRAVITAVLLGAVAFVGCEQSPPASQGVTSTSAMVTVGGGPEQEVDLAGLGDEYFPYAGNGGYDALHYEIELTFDPATGEISGTTVVEAMALQALETFHLDFSGLNLLGVEVDGVSADYVRSGSELIIDSPSDLEEGRTFSVAVTYSGVPVPQASSMGVPQGLQWVEDTAYTLDEPEGAATWFPLNDHPTDKATYKFLLTVPKPYVAVASGVLIETRDEGAATTFVWEMRHAMANYLAAVAVGEFVGEQTSSPGGVPIRDYFDSALAERGREAFARTGEVMDYFVATFGPYPFDEYGVLVVDAPVGGAMENQTLSLFGRDVLEGAMTDTLVGEMFLSHELAHQWFGNSVTLDRWQDIWLNEGFATYASWLWAEHDLGSTGLEIWVEYAVDTLEAEDEAPPAEPGTEGLFGTGVYWRGGLTLHALRLSVGDQIFFDILREWVSRYAYANASTEDFIALVEEKAGHLGGFDLEDFFQGWLFEQEMPPLPEAAAAS